MRTIAVVALMVTAMMAGVRAAERIDRVLAVVNGNVITESDVRAALAFGLVRPAGPGADPVRTTLDQLIRRELILREVARSTPADTASTRIASALDGIRARFGSAAGYAARLEQTAMDETRLRDMVEADILVEDYLTQRFGAVAEPSDADLATYYEAHRAEFASGGQRQTLEQAAAVVRARLIEERRRQLIDEWVARLRRRADVTDLYFAGPAR